MKGRVIIYSITGCPYCMKAKNKLQQLDVPYHDVNLEVYPQERDGVLKRTGQKSVPQIFFNSTLVGGFDELDKLSAVKLQSLIKDVRENEPGPDAPVLPDPSTAAKEAVVGDFQCEPDEYAKLVEEVRNSGLIKDHRTGMMSVQKKSFNGKEFVDWVVKTKGLDRSQAVEMGQALIDRHFGHDVKQNEMFKDDGAAYYRLLDDDDSVALNAGDMSTCEPRPAGEVAEELRKLILKLYAAFLSTDGKRVNYKGIGGSDEFKIYVRLTKELQRVRLDGTSREERLAFFINIYNALVIHGTIEKGAPTNLWQRYKFFNTTRYIIAGQSYSLQDIENGVLRANRKGVGQFSNPFGKNDPRLKVALETAEPRIHFALVCGAKSCPPIKTYTTANIDKELTLATEAFLEGDDGYKIDESKNPPKILLSKILSWYKIDFGKNDQEVVRWVYEHMGEGSNRKMILGKIVKENKFKVEFMSYDWGTNSH